MEYYHQDHLGSTRLKTDANGDAVFTRNYEPFGPDYDGTGSEEFKYTGKHEDPSGLYYFGARYYDPETGRFITEDLFHGYLTDPQSQNFYTYCRNNPLKYEDYDGYQFIPFGPVPLEGLGVIGGILGQSMIGAFNLAGQALQQLYVYMNNFGYYSPSSSNLEDPSQSGPETGVYIDDPEIEDLYGVFIESGIINEADTDEVDKPRIHWGRQGKHIPGHPNYIRGRSILTHPDPQGLVDEYAGTGQRIQGIRGQPGYRERVDFGEIIGCYIEEGGTTSQFTTNGMIIYSKRVFI